MPRRLLSILAFFLLLTAGCGGGDLPQPLAVYEGGRAEVLSMADSGRALLVEHEPFDSTMTQPMVMELRLADPREAEGLQSGDKIQFDLVLNDNYQMRDVQKLPPSTRLNLTSSSDSTSSANSDSSSASTDTTSAAG